MEGKSTMQSKHKKREKKSIIPSLPDLVLFRIFLLLPAKCIQTLRCVCTSWRTIIDHPYFIQTHLSASKPCIIFQSPSLKEPGSMSMELLSLHNRRGRNGIIRLNHDPMVHKHAILRIMATCNGMILFEVGPKKGCLVLANPIIRKSRELPRLPFTVTGTRKLCGYGIAFDRSSSVYKVVALVKISKHHGCMILTVGSDEWREITPPGMILRADLLPVSAGGALHWVTAENPIHRNFNPSYDVIVSLDVAEEKFQMTMPPASINNDNCSLLEIGGALSMMHRRLFFNSWDVWVTKDSYRSGVWEKKYCIDMGCAVLQPLDPVLSLEETTIGFRGRKQNSRRLFLYDSRLRTTTEVKSIQKGNYRVLDDRLLAHLNSVVWWDSLVSP